MNIFLQKKTKMDKKCIHNTAYTLLETFSVVLKKSGR